MLQHPTFMSIKFVGFFPTFGTPCLPPLPSGNGRESYLLGEKTMTRLQELEDFRITLQKLESFLNGTGPKESINILDPDQRLYDFGCSVDGTLGWIKNEIECEEEKAIEALPTEGRRTGALVGE